MVGRMDNARYTLPWDRPQFRDRHGRGMRRPMFGTRIPRYRTSTGRFYDEVIAQLKRLGDAWPELVSPIQCAVEDVPASDPNVWEDRRRTLSRSFPATHGMPARIVLYRRPIETAAGKDRDELQLIIRDELVASLADLYGRHPEDIDPDWGM